MAIKPAKMAILGPNLKNDVPKTSEWARLAQYSSFQCQQRWCGPFWAKRYFGGPIQGPKIPLKPPKMAILRPNLNDGVLPRDNGEVLLWQYTQVSSSSSQSTLPIEDIEHVLTQCVGTSDTRRAKLPALLSLAATEKSFYNLIYFHTKFSYYYICGPLLAA